MLAATSMLKWDQPVKVMDYRVTPCLPGALIYVFREIFIDLAYLFRTPKSNPLILDCGSNIGLSILFFKMLYPEARVVAFEPEPKTFARLQENVSKNGLRDITLHAVAVGREKGTVEFFRDPNEVGSPTASLDRRRVPNAVAETVPLVKLSEFVAGPEAARFGYQVQGTCNPTWRDSRGRISQDVVVYAYRK